MTGRHIRVPARDQGAAAPPVRDGTSTGRLPGIDVLRALAVLAMVWTHFTLTGWWAAGAPGSPEASVAWLNSLLHVRSREIFFLLAGLTVALTTGGCRRWSRARRVRSWPRVLTRACVLFVLALVLGELGSWDVQILHFYAFWLVILLPLSLLPTGSLFVLAGVLSFAAPAFKVLAARQGWFELDLDTLLRLSEHGGFALLAHPQDWLPELQNVVFGADSLSQDTIAVLPFLVLGLALGRTDLHDRAVRVRLVVRGATTAVAAVALGLIAMHPLGAAAPVASYADAQDGPVPWQQLVTLGHPGPAESVFSAVDTVLVLGMITALLGGLLLALERRGWQLVLWPFVAFGSMALTWYFIHFGVFSSPLFSTPDGRGANRTVLAFVGFTAVALAMSVGWRRWSSRGPLEWLQHAAVSAVGGVGIGSGRAGAAGRRDDRSPAR